MFFKNIGCEKKIGIWPRTTSELGMRRRPRGMQPDGPRSATSLGREYDWSFHFIFFWEILSSAQLGESFCFPNKILGYYNSCGGWLHLPVLCPHGSGRGDIVGFSHGKSGLCHLVRLRLLDLWNADGCEHLFYDFFPFFSKKWGCFCFIRECLYGI